LFTVTHDARSRRLGYLEDLEEEEREMARETKRRKVR
jgi:hypothetical protein